MTLFHSERPRECGIVETSENGLVLSFEEKPTHPRSSLANGGIYVMRRAITSRLPQQKPADIGFDLLPQCVGEIYGWLCDGLLLDIGKPDAYARAQQVWTHRQRLAIRGPLRGSEPLSNQLMHAQFPPAKGDSEN
jgi:mannose-1-phosphate guanylyltransferase